MDESASPGTEEPVSRESVPEATISLPARHLKWVQLAAVGNGIALAGLLALVIYALPRSMAYDRLLEENFTLKERLDDIDDKMSEVDRMLLRLRLYDSQLKSLSQPKGDHGPVDLEVLDRIDFANVGPDGEVLGEPLETESGLRDADHWADAVSQRADAFIASMQRTEPNLTDLVVELEDIRALEAALPRHWPTHGRLTSGYGWRRNPVGHRGYRFHSGLDVANRRGTPIVAAAPGVVTRASWSGGYGRVVEIDHGYGITSTYAHCHRLFVKKGQEVVAGQRIALMGSTGKSTGPHLHFEIRLDGSAVDPMDYLPRFER